MPSCEFFPVEAVRTNVLGCDNVLDSAIRAAVKKVIVQKSPANTIRTLAEAMLDLYQAPNEIRIIDTRHCEKKYETLVNREEMVKAEDLGASTNSFRWFSA